MIEHCEPQFRARRWPARPLVLHQSPLPTQPASREYRRHSFPCLQNHGQTVALTHSRERAEHEDAPRFSGSNFVSLLANRIDDMTKALAGNNGLAEFNGGFKTAVCRSRVAPLYM